MTHLKQAAAPRQLRALGHTLAAAGAVGQANILSTLQDLNALCTDPTTATSAHVKKACDLLTRHITKAFRQVSGLPLALQLAPLVGALKKDVVSKAALDMCLRLMPGAATQQVEEVWQVLPGLNFPQMKVSWSSC